MATSTTRRAFTPFTIRSNFALIVTTLSSSDQPINHTSYDNQQHQDSLPSNFLDKLRSEVPGLKISVNPYDLESHGKGESYLPCKRPEAVLFPSSTRDVASILRRCSEDRVPVIPFGAGTSLEGHVSAIHGGVSLDMAKFDDVNIPDDSTLKDRHVRVGAGVTRLRLNDALRHSGMQFMVDPGADATLGGMVACGASGTSAVKYGTMRENILALECVLPDGTIATCGTSALKNSAGYDLVGLMTGSEGTLGVITSVVVKLHPIPDNITAAVCTFQTLHEAAEAVSTMMMMSVPVERCELLDACSIKAFNLYRKKHDYEGSSEMDVKPTLFLEFSGPSPSTVENQINMAKSICLDDFGASNFIFAKEEKQRKALWSARHKLYYASINSRKGAKSALVTDACVPLSRLADLITSTAVDVKELNVVGLNFGHAGDGNFHCILPIRDDDSNEYMSRVHRVNSNLIQRTIDAGGTCTGEHGVGYGKKKYLVKQFGEGGVEFMRRVKKGIDPKNIMNPGKIV